MVWSLSSIPDQSGKVAIVTGSNTGIGFEMARHLARKGAHVIVATRSADKGNVAVGRIREDAGKNARVEFMRLDLASSTSIQQFSDAFQAKQIPLNILINNAGVAFVPHSKTDDWYETTVGVNHLGTFLLTNLLLDTLKKSAPARVVTVSSSLALRAKADIPNLKGDALKKYAPFDRYSSSKLYNIMFAQELESRLEGTGVHSYVCHPGLAKTDIFNKVDKDSAVARILSAMGSALGQSSENGAISALYCATATEVDQKGARYLYGPRMPGNLNNTRAAVVKHKSVNAFANRELWENSERIVRVA